MQSEAMGGGDKQAPGAAPFGEDVALAQLDGVEQFESVAFIHDEPFLTIVYEDGQFVGELVRQGEACLAWAAEVGLRYGLILDGVCMGDDGGYMGLRFREIGGYSI